MNTSVETNDLLENEVDSVEAIPSEIDELTRADNGAGLAITVGEVDPVDLTGISSMNQLRVSTTPIEKNKFFEAHAWFYR